MRRPIVDKRFAAELRRLLTAHGTSFRGLAARTHYSSSYIHDLAAAQRWPTPETAQRLDAALGAGGRLAALVIPAPEPTAEHAERVEYVLAHPTRLDATAVAELAGVLAAYRRLDDATDARVLLPAAQAQWQTVSRLAVEARGPHAPDLHRAVAEWTQFMGWLLAEDRSDDAHAALVLDQAHDEAVELDDGPLAAQAADFRAYLARLRQQWRPAARWSRIAADTPGATNLQRAQNLSHAAYSLARVDERREAAELLGQARDLTAADEPQPDTVYWLSPGFIRLGIGLALHGIGDRQGAAEQLHAGLDGLPEGWAEAEWAVEYRQALDQVG